MRAILARSGLGLATIRGHVVGHRLGPQTQQRLLRLEQESRDGGRSWVDKLYLLRKSTTDGREYEVAYTREN